MWFGKCSGKQELHIKIGRDMWWFLNDFGIGKPPNFSSRNSVEHRPIVKNLGRFVLSKCDNRHSKIFVLGGNSNIYLPRNLRYPVQDGGVWRCIDWLLKQLDVFQCCTQPSVSVSPFDTPLGTSLFEWKDHPGFPQIGTSKMIVTSYTPPPLKKRWPQDLRYF